MKTTHVGVSDNHSKAAQAMKNRTGSDIAAATHDSGGSDEPSADRGRIEKVLALIDKWKTEPGDLDERVGEILEHELPLEQVSLGEGDES